MSKRADRAKGRIGMAGLRQRKPFALARPRNYWRSSDRRDPFLGVRREH